MDEPRTWAREEFGSAELGDARRTQRLVRLAARVAERPTGAISAVYKDSGERQAAYDFFGNSAITSEAVLSATTRATAARCAGQEFVYVPIDGTSLTLTDRAKKKPLGSIGARRFPTRGLKVIDAIAVTPDGVPQGVLDLQFWARSARRPKKIARYRQRQLRQTEMRHWSAAVERATDVLDAHAPAVRPWFVMDREADEATLLRELSSSDAWFSVRAAQNRVVEVRGKRQKLFAAVRATKPLGRRDVELKRTPKRAARSAVLELRATRLTLQLPTYTGHDKRVPVEMGVVEVRERGKRRDRVHWVLLTNAPLATTADVERVVDSYVARWLVEEFHRTWKAGGCDAETIQLRTAEGIRKWAILLAAVATRTERLKHLSRTQPDEPATVELTDDEITALILAKRRIKTRVEVVPDDVPTIRTATRWIADLGGYAGHYKGYEPGATTISRGLADLAIWTEAVRAVRENPEIKPKKR